ncbi:MAG: HEPN domain-containing protein [Myxococcota bacterium]
MSDSAARLEEAALWLAKAEQHLLAARILRDGRGPTATACFLCQQAAETALKGALVASGLPPPRAHNLVDLCARLPVDLRPTVDLETLGAWTLYAVAPRYPGFGDARSEADLPAMLDGVERLVAEIRSRMGPIPTSSPG